MPTCLDNCKGASAAWVEGASSVAALLCAAVRPKIESAPSTSDNPGTPPSTTGNSRSNGNSPSLGRENAPAEITRVNSSDAMTEAPPPSPPPQSLLRILRTVGVIGVWYCISAVVILTSKWVLSKRDATDNSILFPFPLLITTCSNTIATVWAFIFTRPAHLRPGFPSRAQIKNYVVPISVVTALDIGCSNVALKILTVSFGTIIKGSAPVFTMLWGLAFGIERFSIRVSVALVVIATGVGLATFGEGKDFLLLGFLLQLTATSLAGLRWALTQVILDGSGPGAEPLPPLGVVLYTSPATAAFIFPFALAIEAKAAVAHLFSLSAEDFMLLVGLAFAIGTLVFVLLTAEYWVVRDTSSLALSVAAVFKELLTIGGGILVFSDRITPLNIVGFVTCQVGIASYVYLRYNMPKSKTAELDAEQTMPLTGDLEDPWDDNPSPMPPMSRPRIETRPSPQSFV